MALVPVDSVEFGDGILSWKNIADGTPGSVKEAEIPFVLSSSDLDKTRLEFVVCCLAEDAGNSEHPYRASFLTTNTLPEHILQDRLIRSLPDHLVIGPSNNVDVIVSVKSGTNLALHFWQSVLQPLLALSREVLRPPSQGHAHDAPTEEGEPHVVVTQSAHSVRQYAGTLAVPDGSRTGGGSRTIVLLSGDGGVVDLLNGREQRTSGTDAATATRPVIALMPLGTGNALFHSLHKPLAAATDASPLVLALRTLFFGSPTKLPTFRASFSSGARITSFRGAADSAGAGAGDDVQKQETPVDHLQGAIVASYGFHASVVYESDTPEYRIHGAKRFGMVAQDLLRESHPYTAHVDIRRPKLASAPSNAQLERLPREAHAYVLTTLVSNLERSFCISPDSQPLDGKLRLVHFGPIGGERTMEAMMAAYDGGKHVGMKWDDGGEVGYEQIEEVRVTVLEEEERWRKVCVDGTIVDVPQGGHMSVTTNTDGGFQILVDPSIIRA